MEYIIAIFLVSLSGLFSGLTIGLTGLDKHELERKMRLGSKEAEKIYRVRKSGNLLLCSLLLGNVAVNSALSIFLGSIASGLIAGLIATALIVVFGEIIPAAACSRFALQIGARTAWLVRVFIFLLYPVCKPMSMALDRILGDELPSIWSRKELKEIIRLHEDSDESDLDEDEERILLGALSFSDKLARDVMTPRTVVFALELDQVIDDELIAKIKEKGFTRIPVYDGSVDHMVGILYVKDLVGVASGIQVKAVYRQNSLVAIPQDKKLDDLLNEFTESKSHLAFVFDEYGGFQGLVTLEDVIEEIIGSEIVDETDTVVDLRELSRKKARAKLVKLRKEE